jgi:hypothetical protein
LARAWQQFGVSASVYLNDDVSAAGGIYYRIAVWGIADEKIPHV